jgi:hypothetical protein
MLVALAVIALAVVSLASCGRTATRPDSGTVGTASSLEAPSWSAGPEDPMEERHLAAEHRSALPALRGAEADACAGLAQRDVDASPFEHRADLASVSLLVDTIPQGVSAPLRELVGVSITFRRVPGLTRAWLERAIDCHLARDAAAAHEMPEMPDCPLVPAGVTARVRETERGLVVDVRGADAPAAEEVARRGMRLLPTPPP